MFIWFQCFLIRKNESRGGEYKLKNDKKENQLNEKQKRFCEEYIKDYNGEKAAIRAKYSERTAYSMASRLLKNVKVKAYLNELTGEIKEDNIAEAKEVMEYLTSVIRGQSKSEIVVVEGVGEGCSKAKNIKKKPDEKEKLKAAELLGKRYALFTDKQEIKVALPVVIGGEDDLEEQ